MIQLTTEAEIYFEKNIEKNSKPPAANAACDIAIPFNINFLNKKSSIRIMFDKFITFLKPSIVFKLKIFLGKHSLLFADYKKEMKE